MKIFKCNVCGNIVELVHEGGGELVCCGKPMEEKLSKTTEEGNEKHLPVTEIYENEIKIKVGSIEHPMTEAHYIEWIMIKYNNRKEVIKLSPNEKPFVTFKMEEDFNILEIYEYCNVHGLWKSTLNKQ